MQYPSSTSRNRPGVIERTLDCIEAHTPPVCGGQGASEEDTVEARLAALQLETTTHDVAYLQAMGHFDRLLFVAEGLDTISEATHAVFSTQVQVAWGTTIAIARAAKKRKRLQVERGGRARVL